MGELGRQCTVNAVVCEQGADRPVQTWNDYWLGYRGGRTIHCACATHLSRAREVKGRDLLPTQQALPLQLQLAFLVLQGIQLIPSGARSSGVYPELHCRVFLRVQETQQDRQAAAAQAQSLREHQRDRWQIHRCVRGSLPEQVLCLHLTPGWPIWHSTFSCSWALWGWNGGL